MRGFMYRRFYDPAGGSGGGGAVTLSASDAAAMTEALNAANNQVRLTREQFAESQRQIAAALQQQQQLNNASEQRTKELDARLQGLATQVEKLALENTNLIQLTRQQSRSLAQSNHSDGPFMARGKGCRGSIFESRRQAIELGYFVMGTMGADRPARQYAQKWMREQAKDLEFLPNIGVQMARVLGESTQSIVQRCMSKGLEYGAEALAGNVTPGSVLVFPSFANTFIRNVEEYGVFRREAMNWPMGSDTVYIPRRIGGVSVTWVSEAATGTTTDPNFDMLMMVAKKAMMLHYFSSELAYDENAAISLADLVMFEFATAIAKEEDNIGFNGTGSSSYAGFVGVLGCPTQAYVAEASENKNATLKYDAATGLDRTDEITQKGLRGTLGLCHTWSRPGGKWFMHRTVHQDIAGIEITGYGPLARVDAKGVPSLLGYPVCEVEVMPASPGTASTNTFAFGDLRKGWMLGDRRQMEVFTSEHYLFNTDQIAMRVTERVAIQPISPTAMVVYVTAA